MILCQVLNSEQTRDFTLILCHLLQLCNPSTDKGENQNKFFSVLPKRCWFDYFFDKIVCNPALDSDDETHEDGSRDEEDSVDVSTDADDDSE